MLMVQSLCPFQMTTREMKQKDFFMDPHMTPSALGYRMPAEWEPHKATWLAWPHDVETWPDQLAEVEAIYIEVIEYLHLDEEVHILVEDKPAQEYVFRKLRKRGIRKNVSTHLIKTDSPWIRDYGPLFLIRKRGGLAFSKWHFNAWGRKYPFRKDNRVADELISTIRAQPFRAEMILEGGSIDVNGLGACITTEQCLLNPNRNRGRGRKEIEQYVKDFLGVRHLIWLKEGIKGDDTDGHVDEIARFVAPRMVVCATERDPSDQNFNSLRENYKRLCHSMDQDGSRLTIISLPMPEKLEVRRVRFPASYVNFYVANTSVLVPVYHQKNDAVALGILRDLFPKRNVVGIFSIPLVYGQGAIHCITQQQPTSE